MDSEKVKEILQKYYPSYKIKQVASHLECVVVKKFFGCRQAIFQFNTTISLGKVNKYTDNVLYSVDVDVTFDENDKTIYWKYVIK